MLRPLEPPIETLPDCRLSGWSGRASFAPGSSAISVTSRRLSNGRLVTSCVRIVLLTFDCVTSISGDAPATVTVSWRVASPSVRLIEIVPATGNDTFSWIVVENPGISAITV